MSDRIGNIFLLPESLPSEREFSEVLLKGKDVLLERIISNGQITPEGQWYNQEKDEWVVLLQGEAVIVYEDGSSDHLGRGDGLFIPAHKKHRISKTSVDPPCIWLALHTKI